MAVNKVDLANGETLIDLTGDSATEAVVFEGATFHGADGEAKAGTFTITEEITEQDSLIAQIKVALQGKAAGGGGAGNTDLPDGYRRSDFIQFTGEQIIDTGIICNQNTQIRLAFTREKAAQHYLYGVASSGNTASVTAYLGGSWRFGNKASTKTLTTNADMIYSAVVNSSTVTITGSASAISSVNEFETVGTLILGGCRSSNGTIADAQFVGKVFFFVMYHVDEQVLHLVPVTDGSAFRFWDTVSETFFDSITDVPLEGGNL